MAATNRNKALAAAKAKAAKAKTKPITLQRNTITPDKMVAAQIFLGKEATEEMAEKGDHSHYFKDVQHLETLDVYRVLKLFNVTDPCIQHAVKKLLVAGGRGAGKDITQDIEEAIDSLDRWLEMANEDAGA